MKDVVYMQMELSFKLNSNRILSLISSGTWKFGADGSDESYRDLSDATGTALDHITRAHQTHTDIVKRVTLCNGGYGVLRGFEKGDEFDGMVTNEKGLMLGITVADCVPVLLYDPVKRCIGAVHSGWRGTAKEISARAIEMMADEFGSRPSDIEVCIGPCICGKCYEVGEELIDDFRINYSQNEIETFFKITNRIDKDGKPKYLLDLPGAIVITLIKCGIPSENITLPRLCTFETEELGSWRRTGNKLFQNLACIMIK